MSRRISGAALALTIGLAGLLSTAVPYTAAAQTYDVRKWVAPGPKGPPATAAELTQLQADLRSPDAAVRLAAAAAAATSNDMARVSKLMSEALISSDPALADFAARLAFQRISHRFTPEPVEDLSDTEEAAYVLFMDESWGLKIGARFYNSLTGVWENGTNSSSGSGVVSGARITFQTSQCAATLERVTGTWSYEGLVRCKYNQHQISSRMRVNLQ